MDPRCTIRPPTLLVGIADQPPQAVVGDPPRAGRTPLPLVEALPGDPHQAAQQGDVMLCFLRRDEPKPHFGASLSLAKKSAALRKISRSARSWRFSSRSRR